MKNITFIRHYKLEPPYDNKDTITHEQYILLSKGEIDPHINTDVSTYIENSISKYDFDKISLILSSPSVRTQESALALNKVLHLEKPIVVTDLLKECVWDPSLEGSRILRFIQGKEMSTLEETWKRIHTLELFLHNQQIDTILCVTHSFFMQILYLYFCQKFNNWSEITETDIKNSFHGDYLKGFRVSL